MLRHLFTALSDILWIRTNRIADQAKEEQLQLQLGLIKRYKENAMTEPEAVELKVHLPSRDFEVSKQFYQDFGFTLCWSNGDLALLHYGSHGVNGLPAILLQNYYVKELAENLQMHLLVKDVDAWWAHLQAKQISRKYSVEIGLPEGR